MRKHKRRFYRHTGTPYARAELRMYAYLRTRLADGTWVAILD